MAGAFFFLYLYFLSYIPMTENDCPSIICVDNSLAVAIVAVSLLVELHRRTYPSKLADTYRINSMFIDGIDTSFIVSNMFGLNNSQKKI